MKSNDLPKVAQDIRDAIVAAKAIAAQSKATQEALRKDEEIIAAARNDWFGAKTHRLTKTILFIGIPSFAVLGIILNYTGGLPAFAHLVLGIASGGIHFVLMAIRWLISKFHKGKQ